MKYAIWFKPSEEWVANKNGVVLTFETIEAAEDYRDMIDVVTPLSPNMEVREYVLQDNVS